MIQQNNGMSINPLTGQPNQNFNMTSPVDPNGLQLIAQQQQQMRQNVGEQINKQMDQASVINGNGQSGMTYMAGRLGREDRLDPSTFSNLYKAAAIKAPAEQTDQNQIARTMPNDFVYGEEVDPNLVSLPGISRAYGSSAPATQEPSLDQIRQTNAKLTPAQQQELDAVNKQRATNGQNPLTYAEIADGAYRTPPPAGATGTKEEDIYQYLTPEQRAEMEKAIGQSKGQSETPWLLQKGVVEPAEFMYKNVWKPAWTNTYDAATIAGNAIGNTITGALDADKIREDEKEYLGKTGGLDAKMNPEEYYKNLAIKQRDAALAAKEKEAQGGSNNVVAPAGRGALAQATQELGPQTPEGWNQDAAITEQQRLIEKEKAISDAKLAEVEPESTVVNAESDAAGKAIAETDAKIAENAEASKKPEDYSNPQQASAVDTKMMEQSFLRDPSAVAQLFEPLEKDNTFFKSLLIGGLLGGAAMLAGGTGRESLAVGLLGGVKSFINNPDKLHARKLANDMSKYIRPENQPLVSDLLARGNYAAVRAIISKDWQDYDLIQGGKYVRDAKGNLVKAVDPYKAREFALEEEKHKLQVYKADIDAKKADIDLYKTNVEAQKTEFEIEGKKEERISTANKKVTTAQGVAAKIVPVLDVVEQLIPYAEQQASKNTWSAERVLGMMSPTSEVWDFLGEGSDSVKIATQFSRSLEGLREALLAGKLEMFKGNISEGELKSANSMVNALFKRGPDQLAKALRQYRRTLESDLQSDSDNVLSINRSVPYGHEKRIQVNPPKHAKTQFDMTYIPKSRAIFNQ